MSQLDADSANPVFARISLMRVLTIIGCLLFSFSAFADPVPLPMSWVKVSEMFYSPLQVRMWGPLTLSDPQPWNGVYIRVNVSDPYPSPALQPNTWYSTDLTALGVGYDPATGGWIGATMAFVSGIEIITGGTSVETNEPAIYITFARLDDAAADCTKYIGQAVVPNLTDSVTGANIVGGGVRSNVSTVIPLKDGKFKFCFRTTTTGAWPDHPSYGVNLTVQMWGH